MKARFFALAALVLGLASCQNDFDAANVPVGGEVDFQLAVGAEELATRAGADRADDTLNDKDSAYGAIDYLQATDWSAADLRYSLEVWDVEEGVVKSATPVKDRMVKVVPSYEKVVFDLRLVPGREYRFVVFADFVPEGTAATDNIDDNRELGLRHIIGDNLSDITFKSEYIDGKKGLNDELTDAYFQYKDITIDNSATQTMELKRPYGKLRVVATDLHELNLNFDPGKVIVKYTQSTPTKFNALTGEVAVDAESKEFEVVLNGTKESLADHYYTAGYDSFGPNGEYKYISANGEERHTHMTLFTDYILAEAEQTPYHFTMTVLNKDGGDIKTTAFTTDIPVQRNYLTTVIGNVLTTATHIDVVINDNFDGNHNFNLWDGKLVSAPEYDDATKTYTIREASELAWVAAQVNGTTRAATQSFKDYTFELAKDIHLNGELWTAIGTTATPFSGTFDGKGHTIEALFAYAEGTASAGLFGYCPSATIKNLNVINSEVRGNFKAAVIVADANCTKIENCTVDNCVVVSTPHDGKDANNVGAIAGYLAADGGVAYIKGCTVTNTEITAYRKVGGIVGAANLTAEISGNTVKATKVTADMTPSYEEVKPADVGAVVGWANSSAVVEDNTVYGGINTKNEYAVTVRVVGNDAADINDNQNVSFVLPEGEYTFDEDVKSQGIRVEEGDEVVFDAQGNNVESGTANLYAFGATGEGASLVIKDAEVDARGGGIGASGGAEVTFESGSIYLNTTSTSGRYFFYAEGEGTVITVEDGNFTWNTSNNAKRAYACALKGGKVIINGGTFGKASTRSGYSDGIKVMDEQSEVIINGGTFGFDPTRWVAPGRSVKKDGENWVVEVVADPMAAVTEMKDGDAIVVPQGSYTFPSSDLKNKKVTVICEEGTVFEGNSKLNINGSTVIGATFSNPDGTAVDQTINGTFKDCTFTGINGLRWAYAGKTCVFENCVFDGSLYGAHFDGGANEVTFKNCVFSGFNAFAGAITQLNLEGCTFKAGRSGYNGANLWGSTAMKNCEFIFDGSVSYEWIDCIDADGTFSFDNCVINGVAYTAENYTEYLNYIESRNDITVKINGVDCAM